MCLYVSVHFVSVCVRAGKRSSVFKSCVSLSVTSPNAKGLFTGQRQTNPHYSGSITCSQCTHKNLLCYRW